MHLREMEGVFLGKCLIFHKIWSCVALGTVPGAIVLCQLQFYLQNYWVWLAVLRICVSFLLSPTFSYFSLFFNHSQTRCLIPFLSQIFSKFQAFQLCVCKLVKNDKIFLLELASSQDDDHYIMRRRFCLSFVQFARQLFCSNIF